MDNHADIYEQCSSAYAQISCMPTQSSASLVQKRLPFRVLYRKRDLRADLAKLKSIVNWPVLKNQKDLRKWLGLANYLNKYSANYADMAWTLSNLLKKDVEWCWTSTEHASFQAVNESLLYAPTLALPDPERSLSVVCDASDFAIGSALLQKGVEGQKNVIALEYGQLKAAE